MTEDTKIIPAEKLVRVTFEPEGRTVEFEFGTRVDLQDYQGFGLRSQLTPRVNLRYDLSDAWHAYGSWGQFAQAHTRIPPS